MRSAHSSEQQAFGRRHSRRRLLGRGLLSLAGLVAGAGYARAGHPWADKPPLGIAVASNFRPVLDLLLQQRAPAGMPPIAISSGSTGVLYQQIRFGAPFDVFLAADQLRPQRLYEQGMGEAPRLYCRGRLALVSQHSIAKGDIPTSGLEQTPPILSHQRVALADPKLAPYGVAADAVLRRWDIDASQQLLATNTAQALQWFTQGKADWALLPLSLVKQARLAHQTIDASQHPAIDQYCLRLSDSDQARQFEQWLLSDVTQTIIADQGYVDIHSAEDVVEEKAL